MDGENQLGVPLAARHGHSVTWTGAEVVAWGGDQDNVKNGPAFNDGVAFDPSTSRWRSVAPAPVTWNPFHLAVWTGEEILFIGGRQNRRQILAYDPVGDAWSERADSPFDVAWPTSAVAWTGERLLAWTSSEGMAAYDPRADRWAEVDAPPVSSRYAVALHVDTRTDPATIVAVGGPEDQRGIHVAWYAMWPAIGVRAPGWINCSVWTERFWIFPVRISQC